MSRWSPCAGLRHQEFHDLFHTNSLVENKKWMDLVIDSHIVEGIRPVKNDEREESTTFQAVFISSSGTVVSCETDQ